MADEPQPESFEVDEVNEVAENNRDRFMRMGFEAMEAMILAFSGAHPTEVEDALKSGCPKHLALEIFS